MNPDVTVRKLVEFVFDKEPEVSLEIRAQDSSFPSCLMTNDFVEKLSHVFTVKKAVVHIKWSPDFDDFYTRDQLTGHKSYFTYIIFACLKAHHCQSNVFESFITVCSGVEFFSRTTLRRTGLDYCELNTDIVMEIYESVLKKTFLRRNGFKRLVEYISNHRYLAWDLDLISRAILLDPSAEDMKDKLKKEVVSESKTRESFKVDLQALLVTAIDMAQKLLSKISVKLAGFSSDLSTKDTATAFSLSDSSKLHASTKSVTQKDLSTASVEPPILPKDRDSKGTVRASTKTKTQKVSSVTSVEPPILPTDRATKETASASTKTKKQKVSSVTSVESSNLPSDRVSKGKTSVSAKTKTKKVSSSATSIEPSILTSDRNSKGIVGESTKATTQNISSVTSVEPPILPTNRASKETVSASTDTMKQKVPSITSVEPPIFPSNHDSNQKVNVSKLTNAAKKIEEKEKIKTHIKFVTVENSQDISSPYSNAHPETKRPQTFASYESVVERIIKYNQSKITGPVSSKNAGILKNAGEVLEYLKDTIKSIIDLLDEYDEE